MVMGNDVVKRERDSWNLRICHQRVVHLWNGFHINWLIVKTLRNGLVNVQLITPLSLGQCPGGQLDEIWLSGASIGDLNSACQLDCGLCRYKPDGRLLSFHCEHNGQRRFFHYSVIVVYRVLDKKSVAFEEVQDRHTQRGTQWNVWTTVKLNGRTYCHRTLGHSKNKVQCKHLELQFKESQSDALSE